MTRLGRKLTELRDYDCLHDAIKVARGTLNSISSTSVKTTQYITLECNRRQFASIQISELSLIA